MTDGGEASDDVASDSDTEWIEVESSVSNYVPLASTATNTPSRPLEITLHPKISKKKLSIVDRYMKMHERSQRLHLHNTHVMCLLSRTLFISKLCSEPVWQAALLSLTPGQLVCTRTDTRLVQTHIEQVMWWFQKEFGNLRSELEKELQACIEQFQLTELYLFVSLLRALGYRTRLVQNLIVTQGIEAHSKKSNNRIQKRSSDGVKKIGTASSTSTCRGKSPYFKTKSENCSDTQVSRQSDRLKRLKVDYRFRSTPQQTADSEDEFQTPKKRKKGNKMPKSQTKISKNECAIPIETNISVSKQDTGTPQSPVSEKATPSNEWIEVRLEEGWRPLHYHQGELSTADRCARLASPGSLIYVVGSEGEGRLKDVTARYSLEWGGRHAKLRPDSEAWNSILALYSAPVGGEEELERRMLEETQLSLPLPLKLAHFKSNPYYTLERNLLKFQAIHPEGCPAAGSFREEKVYFRRNVAELHTRENWLKEGRVISQGESVYKRVKGRSKPGAEEEGDRMIELFGKWQTEIYIPPPVVDGKIPRNEFGNVEMFQPFMLPEGGAHVELPGAAHIARKLGIDYALAMVGWEFHGIACHPVFRGVVVARENEQLIREAWRASEEARREKEKTVKERRVFERWRKVIRSALIKERVREKFNISESEMDIEES